MGALVLFVSLSASSDIMTGLWKNLEGLAERDLRPYKGEKESGKGEKESGRVQPPSQFIFSG